MSKEGNVKPFQVHQLIAIVFHNHKPDGYNAVVDHINHIRTDNRAFNLRIIDVRENTTNSKINKKGKLIGAHWSKRENKWKSSIRYGKMSIHIGYFKSESDASKAYMKIKELIDSKQNIDQIMHVVIKEYRKTITK